MTNPTGSAIEQLKNGFFPGDWSYVPVDSNKATYVTWGKGGYGPELVEEKYNKNFHLRPDQISKYPGCTEYQGIGVLTGKESQGLLTIDIDGHEADKRWKEFLGEHYEEHGKETTMAWWSGTPGRRQIAYMLPTGWVPLLDKVKSIIFKEDGTWAKGNGDSNRTAEDRDKKYEEVVIRFNGCMSVLPGSAHPSGRTYEWLNYNDGMPEEAPMWLLEILKPYRDAKAGWDLIIENRADMDALETAGQLGNAGKYGACYAWWEKHEHEVVPRMKELIFNHPTFEKYGWVDRDGGENPQYTSGCPIHGGESGTSFQIQQSSGLWDCKGCKATGNMLQFAMKAHMDDWNAEPAAWRSKIYDVMKPIAEALGYDFDKELQSVNKQLVEIAPTERMSDDDWFKTIGKIINSESNPAKRRKRLADLALDQGYRYTGTQVESQYNEYIYAEDTERLNSDPLWYNKLKGMEYVIPHLLRTPSQTILHSAGGVGKSATALALARAVGRGEVMRIKGMDIKIPQGKVLWINSDQSDEKLYQDCIDNGFEHEDFVWFIVKRNYQMAQYLVLRDWIQEHEPALVVIDSIGSCSSHSTVSEIEKGFADPLYWMNGVNGSVGDIGCPSTAILYIHHDNANGEARGNRYVINAIDEQWQLRKPKDDEERQRIQQSGFNPHSTRVLQWKKSRQGREGDCFLVERDVDHRYCLHDWTPTVREEAPEDEGGTQRDPEAVDVVLDLVKRATEKQREESTSPKLGVTVAEVYEQLCERMLGWSSSKPPSRRSVERWLNRWVEKKLLLSEKRKTSRGNVMFYVSRALRSRSGSLSSLFQNPNAGQGSEVTTENAPEAVVVTPTHELVTSPPETGGDDTPPEAESCRDPETQTNTEVSPEATTYDIQANTTRAHEDDEEEPDMSGF